MDAVLGPLSLSEQAERREAARRARSDEDLRIDAARVALFGRASGPTTSAVTLPLSGVRFDWRTDGFYREADGDEADDLGDDDWISWEEATGGGRYEVAPGDSAEATWWLDWGHAAPADQVNCWLADDTHVPVIRLGWLWIAERVTTAQPMFVEINGEVTEIEARRPHYRPAAEHPFTCTAPNPRQAR